jgi:hypothetical protein
MEPVVGVALVFSMAGLWSRCTILLLSRANIAERKAVRPVRKLDRI